MQKRLLIISDAFTPPLYGQRMTQLCKYLSASGWDITLLTEQIVGDDYSIPNCRFIAMPYYSKSAIKHHWQWLTDKLFDWKNRLLYRFAKQNICINDFAVVLCSTFNLFPLPAASRLAQEAHLPLLVDLRDITEQWNADSYLASALPIPQFIRKHFVRTFERICIRRRNAVLSKAFAITTISTWHQQVLQAINPNTHLIYNGFDSDVYIPRNINTPKCLITYLGRLYDFTSRNPQLFLDAIHDLHTLHLISSDTFHIEFHIEKQLIPLLQDKVQQYGIQDYFDIGGYVPRQEALSMLQRSSISLLFVAKPSPNAPRGIMTTKFFEALGCEKPILCIPSDEGCLAQTIRDTNAGIASSDLNEIKAFILEKYHEWQHNGYTHQAVVNKEQFSRRHQAEQFEQLLLSADTDRPLLTDICWTLYRSNTTFDFLDRIVRSPHYRRIRCIFSTTVGKHINLLILKLFHFDLQRSLALRCIRHIDNTTLLEKARTFRDTYLEQRKNAEVFDTIQGRKIVLASGTMDVIAKVVAEQLHPVQTYSSRILKNQLLNRFTCFDIITDNTADIALIRKAHRAYIVVYDDLPRWQKLTKGLQNTQFIYVNGTKY